MKPAAAPMDTNSVLLALEWQVEQLSLRCQQQQQLLLALQRQNEQLLMERAALTERGEQARTRVEAMISRLKSMEHGA